MTVEYDAVYVADLDPELPADTDDLSEGNDHIMLVKQVLQNTFPDATTALVADFNYINQLPTRITYVTDVESDTDSTTVIAMDMTGNRLKNIHDAYEAQDVPSLAQVQELITTAVSNGIYPVGSLYTSRINTNPADVLGFGTWLAVSGGIFGYGTFTGNDGTAHEYKVGNTYGSIDVVLEADNIPEMNIDMGAEDDDGNPYVVTATDPGHTHEMITRQTHVSIDDTLLGMFPRDDPNNSTDVTETAGAHNHVLEGTLPFGNATPTAVSTLSPINVFYIWERTA